MKVKDLFSGVWQATPMKLPNMFNAADVEKAINTARATAQTVTMRDTATGKIIGHRTIYQK